VFTNAYSTSAWTCTAHASLFTGLYPAAHHVTQEAWSMPDSLVTLAEVLHSHGFRTVGIAGNPMVRSSLGFAQGFDEYDETWRKEQGQAPAGGAHPAVSSLAHFVDADRSKPFFAFVNLIEPHSPYLSGPYIDEFRRHPGNRATSNHWRAFFTGEGKLSTRDLENLSDRYDGEIRYTDDIVGELVSVLSSRGLLDRTVVVVTADHGENFGEHGLVDHVFNLYDTTTRVPLLIRFPGTFDEARRADPVQLQDLFPTLLAAVGVENPGSQGLDLAHDAIDPHRPLLLSYGFPKQALGALDKSVAESEQLDRYRRRLWAVVVDHDKLIVGDDGSVECYDLASDPGELHDLAPDAASQDLVTRLHATLDTSLAKFTREPPKPNATEGGERDDDTLKELRNLGYAE